MLLPAIHNQGRDQGRLDHDNSVTLVSLELGLCSRRDFHQSVGGKDWAAGLALIYLPVEGFPTEAKVISCLFYCLLVACKPRFFGGNMGSHDQQRRGVGRGSKESAFELGKRGEVAHLKFKISHNIVNFPVSTV